MTRTRRADGTFKSGSAPKPRPTNCDGCGAPLVQRYGKGLKARKWCTPKCKTDTLRARARAARRDSVALARPRCMICDAPLPYGKRGWRLANTTCSRACKIKRYNWFVRRGAA